MVRLSISGSALISMPRATRPSSRRSTTRDQSAHTQFAESGLGGDRCRGGGTRDRATRTICEKSRRTGRRGRPRATADRRSGSQPGFAGCGRHRRDCTAGDVARRRPGLGAGVIAVQFGAARRRCEPDLRDRYGEPVAAVGFSSAANGARCRIASDRRVGAAAAPRHARRPRAILAPCPRA